MAHKDAQAEQNAQNEKISSDSPKKNKKISPEDKLTADFIAKKKKEMKDSQYRVRFDSIAEEIDNNLVNTAVSYGQKLYEKSGWGSTIFYNKMANGAYDVSVYPQKLSDRDQNRSGVPVSQEPIAFAKIMIATQVLAGKLPDARVICDDKVYARTAYELWKKTWENRKGNGSNTLMCTYQNLFTYGWAAWRVYPRKQVVKRNGADKIIFDDIYREPLDVKRTWLGVGFNNYDFFSQGEVYYEKDMPKEDFFRMYPEAEAYKKDLDYCTTSQEAKEENREKNKTHVTIGYYENVLANRFIIACGKFIIEDDEMPNDDSYGSIVVARCFIRSMNDPYGVGLYELMRGNTAIYTYINSLNAQQVEAEIFPLLFGSQVQNGTGIYRRGPNIVNPKTPGTSIDIINTKGNIQGGILYADKQKENIEQNTGVNNIVAGSNAESTLGSTVILKEAAYNRLIAPRNSVVEGLALDALIANSWIKQTYSVDKVFMIDSEQAVQDFVEQNPNYFMEAQPIMDGEQETGKYAVAASQNLRLNFDFSPDGELLDNVPTRSISAKGLFDELRAHDHVCDYIEFVIDPNSMLLPSIEIQKQTYMSIYPVLTNQITLIFNLRMKDPDAAASQLMAFEQLCEMQNQNIYKYISKKDYDDIMAKKPSEAQMKMMQMQKEMMGQETPKEELPAYKEAPEDIKRQMEAKAGFKPSSVGGTAEMTGPIPADPNEMAAPEEGVPEEGAEGPEMGESMMNDGTDPLEPQNPNEVPRPQSPMGAAVDASMGRAANLPFFPGEFK